MSAKALTFGDVDGCITMLLAACEDPAMNATLESLLSQPDEKRKAVIHRLIERLREKRAPAKLVEAITCLLDDQAAEKAYEVIYHCPRGDGAA